jgi:microcystin-dependent protein
MPMAEPFLSEIRIMSFNFAPKGWALANGQLLPINQNQALFSLLGTTYGGNGQTNFALPDIRGRVAIHEGSGHTLGENGGSEAVTINMQTLPTHSHAVKVFNDNATATPAGNFFAAANNTYQPKPQNTTLAANSVTNTGGSQPHTNQQPFTVLSFCIALQGIFPSQN